ncbi:MAG: Co2+/Mg2+ efflux protein ApaG [Bacteroidia bacterium]|nr:Co2+/Mg2+ efflux protein ApaG [Bacteroidia bacterium]
MFSGNSSKTTQGIRVDVSTAYLHGESMPEHGRFVFAYQVRIVNESSSTVQLLRRKWFITDALGRNRVVEGPGVIGQTPTIQPGSMHEYVSGCDFPVPTGKMEGYFTMIRLPEKEEFKVRIPAFTMTVPWLLN